VSCTCGTSWWLTPSTYAESDRQIVHMQNKHQRRPRDLRFTSNIAPEFACYLLRHALFNPFLKTPMADFAVRSSRRF
jgi:hypothetical protein